MMRNNSIQFYLRTLNYQIYSKLFLALYCAFLVVTDKLLLPSLFCILLIILYLLINHIFFKFFAYKNKSHLTDMALVLCMLYGTEVDNYLIFPFLLYPLISRGVYLDHYTYDRYFFIEYSFLIIIQNFTVVLHDYNYYLWQILPIGIYILLNGIYVMRMRYDEKRIKMLDIADDYFIQQSNSYEVYRHIISFLKDQRIGVSNITCIESDSRIKKYHLVNSSYLVSSYYLKIHQRDVGYLKSGAMIRNAEFLIDGVRQEVNEVYPIIQASNSPRIFLFVVSYVSGNSKLHPFNLEPLFLRMARLITFERIIRKRRDAAIQDMLQKSRFVNSATNTMHFLKNRLTPLQTLIDLAKNDGGVKQLEDYDSLLIETAQSAQKEINVILNKAEYLLNKQNNPFLFNKEIYDAHNIFTTLSSVWLNAFISSPIKTIIKISGASGEYETNMDGIEILFSDIIGNMKKYSKSIQRCVFCQNEESELIITFENDFENRNDVLLLINDINNPNKDAVIYRTSYGLSNIRAITDNLSIGIKATLKLDNSVEFYQLQLTINAKKYENPNY